MLINSRIKLVFFLCIALLFGVGIYFYLHQDARAPQVLVKPSGSHVTVGGKRSGTERTNVVDSVIALPESVVTSAVTTRPTQTSQKASMSIYQRMNSSRDLGALFEELKAESANDAAALYFMSEIIGICRMVHGVMLDNAKERLQRAGTRLQHAAALKELTLRCINLPSEAIETADGLIRKTAAEKGDIRARAWHIGLDGLKLNDAAIAQLQDVREVATSKDPIALQNLVHYFMSLNGKLHWEIPGVEGRVNGVEMAYAMELSACDYGLDCSDTSLESIAYCGVRGFCDSGGREARLRQHQASPAQFAHMQVIRSVLAKGYATNEWPVGFWSGLGVVNGNQRKTP